MKLEVITFDNYKTLTYGADSIPDIMPPVLKILERKVGKINSFMKVYRKLDERHTQIKNTKHVEVRILDIAMQTLYELGYLTSDLMRHLMNTLRVGGSTGTRKSTPQ